MQKIGDSTTTANGAGEYTQGQPGSGIDATMITATWLNAVQRELVNVILGAGITLNPADDSQLLKAIQAIQTIANTWAKLVGKPTTLGGFGITDAFTKNETSNAIQQAVAALVASSPAALDTLKELADAMGNDPNFAASMTNALAGKVSITGSGWMGQAPVITGAISALPTSQLVSTVAGSTTDYPSSSSNCVGHHMVFANNQYSADLLVAINSLGGQLMFRGNGPTAGLGAYRVVWHDGNFNPASKINATNCANAGFTDSTATTPFMTHANGTTVALQINRPKNTALLANAGWSKNADTGEIIQWVEYLIGDNAGFLIKAVSWPTVFPTAFLNAKISFRQSSTAYQASVTANYLNATVAGCSINMSQWKAGQDPTLTLVVEARGY